MPEGVPALVTALTDAEEPVRAAAAFGLGLIARRAKRARARVSAEGPVSVRSRARSAGPGPGRCGGGAHRDRRCRRRLSRTHRGIAPDDEEPKTGEIEACRLSIVALVRLRQFDALARVVLDAQGAAVSQWWPVAFALQRSGDAARRRPAGAACECERRLHAGVCDARAGGIEGSARGRAGGGRGVAAAERRAAAGRSRSSAGPGGAARRDAGPAEAADDRRTPRESLLETITALGALADPRAFDAMLDLFAAESPPCGRRR